MPQYNNPYHVEPADYSLGVDKALTGIAKGAAIRTAKKQTSKDEQAMADFSENFDTMTPVEIGQYVLKNPRVAKFLVSAVDTTNKMTKQENLDSAIEIAQAYISGDRTEQPQPGQPPVQPVQLVQAPVAPVAAPPMIGLDAGPVAPPAAPISPVAPVGPAVPGQIPVQEGIQPQNGNGAAVQILSNQAQEVLERGGDAKESIELTRDAMTGGDRAFKGAMAYIAAHDQSAFNSLMKLQGGGEQKSTPATDSDDFVADSVQVYTGKNPNASEEEIAAERVRARLEHKRTQADEAAKVTTAKTDAQLKSELEGKPKVEASIISAKEAAKLSNEAYGKLSTIKTNIGNLREGITLLKEGAGTGAVESKLPSVRAASVKLDNLQGRLGLDVLHSTTFGALSAAELKFALSTALPQGLDRDELMDWMTEKADAQEKLHDYIEGAAIYLGKPGNTPSGWIERNRNTRMEAENQLPVGVTEDDIKTTMQNNNMTREQVLARLAGQ